MPNRLIKENSQQGLLGTVGNSVAVMFSWKLDSMLKILPTIQGVTIVHVLDSGSTMTVKQDISSTTPFFYIQQAYPNKPVPC